MKKITIVMDEKGNMSVDFSGFGGDRCLKEAERLVEKLKEGGIEIDIKSLTKKTDGEAGDKVREVVKE